MNGVILNFDFLGFFNVSVRISINIFDLTLELGVGNVGGWVIGNFRDGYPEQLPIGHSPPGWVVPNPESNMDQCIDLKEMEFC